MTAIGARRLSQQEVLALRGLRLPALALKTLQQTGIYCDPSVSIQYQTHAHKYVIRGVESGGAVQEMGAYCSFISTDGSPLTWLQKVESVGRNGLHAVVIVPELLRVQMLRNEQTYQLLITRHRLETTNGSARPALVNTIIFRGINGTLESKMGPMNSPGNNTQLPVFRTRSGEVSSVPEEFQWALGKLSAAVCCLGCKHSHLLQAEPSTAVESSQVLSL